MIGDDPATWSPTPTESQRVYHVIWDEATTTWITSSSSTLSELELNTPSNNYGEDPSTWSPSQNDSTLSIGGDPSTWSPSQTDSTLGLGGDPSTWSPSTHEPIYGDDPATYSPSS
jgi:hypothetical protein